MISDEKNLLANWNGQEMPLDSVRVSVMDRAFLFGDAVYEVIRVYNGKPFQLKEHLDRLSASLSMMKIAGVDLELVHSRINSVLANSNLQEAFIYIQITRGEAKRTHTFPKHYTPNQLIYIEKFTDPYDPLRKNGAVAVTYPDIRWSLCDIKSTNLIANCLASQHASEHGAFEAIFVDCNDRITEGSRTSVFAVYQGSLILTPASHQVLPGITKQLITNLANNCKIPIRTMQLSKDMLFNADELFITGTTVEIIPIVKVDDATIGSGKPGPVVQKIRVAYNKFVGRD